MFLLQVNNTTLKNIRWENNTIVYHKSAETSYAPTVSMIYSGTGTSGAGNAKVGTVAANTVFFNNNLVLYDGFGSAGSADKNISQSNNLITTTTSGVVKNLGTSGTTPSATDFDLVDGSPAIHKGMAIANITVDYLNRAVPTGAAADIGAFEYDASLASGQSAPAATMDIVLGKISGDCTSADGASSVSTGNGGASNPATGGAATTSTPSPTGGKSSTTPASNPAAGGRSSTLANPANGGQTAPPASNPGTGGQSSASSPSNPANGGQVSSTPSSSSSNGRQPGASSSSSSNSGQTSPDSTGSPSQGGATSASAPAATGTTALGPSIAEQPGCSCRVVGRSPAPVGVGLVGLLAAGLLGRRRRRI